MLVLVGFKAKPNGGHDFTSLDVWDLFQDSSTTCNIGCKQPSHCRSDCFTAFHFY